MLKRTLALVLAVLMVITLLAMFLPIFNMGSLAT